MDTLQVQVDVGSIGSYTAIGVAGTHNVTATATQSTGETASAQWVWNVADITPPVITVESPQNRTYNTATIPLNVSADETISEWLNSLNGGANVSFTPNTTITAAEGANMLVVRANDTVGNWNSSAVNFTVDTTPPASVTNLTNSTYATTYINWTWTDPADSDFDRVMVYLDGSFRTNVTNGTQYYNATGLTANTEYTISTRTVDTAGNINATWENRTARTAPFLS